MADDEQFESGESGASLVVPTQAGNIKKGGHVCIKGRPCKVVDYSTSKTGKHGHAKANITAIDIFTGKKLEDICPTSHNMDVPVIKRTDMQLIDISDDGFVSLMSDSGDTKDDLKLPENDIGQKIKELFDKGDDILCTVVSAMGEEHILGHKMMNQS